MFELPEFLKSPAVQKAIYSLLAILIAYLFSAIITRMVNRQVKDLKRPKPNLTVKITGGRDGKYEASPRGQGSARRVRVATDVYAYFVKLVVPIEGTKFSDNYFDLFPGQERVIEVWNEAGRQLEENDIAVSCL